LDCQEKTKYLEPARGKLADSDCIIAVARSKLRRQFFLFLFFLFGKQLFFLECDHLPSCLKQKIYLRRMQSGEFARGTRMATSVKRRGIDTTVDQKIPLTSKYG